MGEKTGVGWCDCTYNPWWGCVKVSPGCDICYALDQANDYGRTGLWGPASTTHRRIMAETTQKNPYIWNKQAIKQGCIRRVFSGSMCDICEDHPDVVEPRKKFITTIEETTMLRWQLLTKRPENFNRFFPWQQWPSHVGAGCSVENQKYADKRIPYLLEVPAAYRFLSIEPLLGPVDLSPYLYGLDWLIIGGESDWLSEKNEAREMKLEWVTSIMEQCKAVGGIPIFMKQMGSVWARAHHAEDQKGEKMSEWPKKFQVQQLPPQLLR